MNKRNFPFLIGFLFGTLILPLGAASTDNQNEKKPVPRSHQPSKDTTSQVSEEKQEYELLNRDQIDNSNTLAIPFDDSEVEDEEEIDRDEGKDVFQLPHSR